MKGKGFLKVTGIIMIIFAGIALIGEIINLIIGTRVMDYYTAQAGASMAAAKVVVYGLLAGGIILSGLQLFTGILGIKNCSKPDKSTICIVFGSIILAIDLIGYVITLIIGASMPAVLILLVSIMSLIGMALPILYIIGAALNKNAAVD